MPPTDSGRSYLHKDGPPVRPAHTSVHNIVLFLMLCSLVTLLTTSVVLGKYARSQEADATSSQHEADEAALDLGTVCDFYYDLREQALNSGLIIPDAPLAEDGSPLCGPIPGTD